MGPGASQLAIKDTKLSGRMSPIVRQTENGRKKFPLANVRFFNITFKRNFFHYFSLADPRLVFRQEMCGDHLAPAEGYGFLHGRSEHRLGMHFPMRPGPRIRGHPQQIAQAICRRPGGRYRDRRGQAGLRR